MERQVGMYATKNAPPDQQRRKSIVVDAEDVTFVPYDVNDDAFFTHTHPPAPAVMQFVKVQRSSERDSDSVPFR